MLNQLNNELILGKPRAVLFDTDNTLYEYNIANDIASIKINFCVLKFYNEFSTGKKTGVFKRSWIFF